MSDKKRKRLPTIGMVASGCLLTFLIWFVALSVIFGELAGDCFPELGSQCPLDNERNVGALLIALAAMGINVLVLFFVVRVLLGRKSDD